MEQNIELLDSKPRRKFLTGVLAGMGGMVALLLAPRRARTTPGTPATSGKGPILYRRTEETDRYYKTLYR